MMALAGLWSDCMACLNVTIVTKMFIQITIIKQRHKSLDSPKKSSPAATIHYVLLAQLRHADMIVNYSKYVHECVTCETLDTLCFYPPPPPHTHTAYPPWSGVPVWVVAVTDLEGFRGFHWNPLCQVILSRNGRLEHRLEWGSFGSMKPFIYMQWAYWQISYVSPKHNFRRICSHTHFLFGEHLN